MSTKKIFISAFVLFLIGALFHFVYDWINIPLFAWLFPVNESVFEHTKLLIVPLSLYFFYFMIKDKENIKELFFKLNVSIIVGLIFMVMFYYTVTGISGKNIDVLNISSLFISLLVGLFMARRVGEGKMVSITSSLIVYLSIILFVIVMTYYPFHIPFFYDFHTFKYGI